MGILALLVLVATAIMAKIEKRPVLSYGFVRERRLSRFVLGIAAGRHGLSCALTARSIGRVDCGIARQQVKARSRSNITPV
jgi:hypothetical protein